MWPVRDLPYGACHSRSGLDGFPVLIDDCERCGIAVRRHYAQPLKDVALLT